MVTVCSLCSSFYLIQQIIEMFNPYQLLKNNQSQSIDPNSRPSSSRFALEKMVDHSKSRWDEPIIVPEVLYLKFRLPIPNSSNPKQSKRYPLSLIDFIKRAYDRCRDENQARLMENQLKSIIARHEENYFAVSWQTLPLPNLFDNKKIDLPASLGRDQIIKKQAVNLHKQYSGMPHLQPKEEISNPKMIVNKTLQRLQERLSKKEQGREEQPKKVFTGFTDAPQKPEAPVRTSYINPSLRAILNPTPPPPPPPINKPVLIPPPPPQFQADKKSQIKSKALEQKFSKANQPQNQITVITSITPEPVDFTKKRPIQNLSKQRAKVTISRKQLTQISRVAEKVSDLHQVAKRYESFNKLKQDTIKSIEDNDDDYEDNDEIIVGKSSSIDKPYLRITGRPDPETVRPVPVLQKALAHFTKEYKQGNIAYDVLIPQMKSIRQDLTVQHVRSAFTVEVYEENFKISLFENDIIQVKQCQANLWQLYREGLYRQKELRSKYISYNFTTLILEEKYKQLEYMLTLLPEGSLASQPIQDTLKLKQIILLGNYRAFFDYYNERDQVTRQLLNFYIDKVRMRCLVMFSKTCGQRISFRLLGETIGEDEDVIQALAVGEGAVVRDGSFMLKQSYEKLSKSDFLVTKKVTNLLI